MYTLIRNAGVKRALVDEAVPLLLRDRLEHHLLAHRHRVHAPPVPQGCTEDDDRGKGLNARIVRKLYAGSYWLSVRHKNPQGTGSYSIGVKKSD